MRRLRPLSEAECYARLYGDGDPRVTIVELERPLVRPRFGLSGEALRRTFEQRLDAREADVIEPEAA
jgi:hypothetical protein